MNSAGVSSVALKTRVARKTAAMASGKPTARATPDLTARSRRRWTSATQKPAIGPNSGPTTIAPTMRISESRKMPTAASIAARTMKSRKTPDSSTFSLVRCSTSSQTTASDGAPGALRSASSAAFEIDGVDRHERDRAALVQVERLQVGEDDAGVLARDVAQDHVAVGPLGGAVEADDVDHRTPSGSGPP